MNWKWRWSISADQITHTFIITGALSKCILPALTVGTAQIVHSYIASSRATLALIEEPQLVDIIDTQSHPLSHLLPTLQRLLLYNGV
jgi:hypothetical protein